jgi:Xaa-Pro aminopeptidase
MSTLVQEKTLQAVQILQEKGVDLWLTLVRETSHGGDPILPVIYGETGLTWLSALIFTQRGDRLAIVGRLEAENAKATNAYQEVLFYDQDFRPLFLETLQRLNPQQIAVNMSKNDVLADGLTCGLYQILTETLAGSPFAERLISSEAIIAALNGRKTSGEIANVRAAVQETLAIFEKAFEYASVGMTELQIGHFMQELVKKRGLQPAWGYETCPMVNAGPDSPVGHSGPTSLVLQPGQILHFDFGVKVNGYCSDMQRVVYYLAPGEKQPPAEVQRGFETVVHAVQAAAAALKPGVTGHEIDSLARKIVTDAGYPEFKYALGHQLGRHAHDGGGLLGPHWEKYGLLPDRPLEAGQIYTLEPGLLVPGVGYIGLEEDLVITEHGAEFLGEPQTRLIVK